MSSPSSLHRHCIHDPYINWLLFSYSVVHNNCNSFFPFVDCMSPNLTILAFVQCPSFTCLLSAALHIFDSHKLWVPLNSIRDPRHYDSLDRSIVRWSKDKAVLIKESPLNRFITRHHTERSLIKCNEIRTSRRRAISVGLIWLAGTW